MSASEQLTEQYQIRVEEQKEYEIDELLRNCEAHHQRKKLQEFVSESLAEKGIDAASLHRWARQIEELQVLRGLDRYDSGDLIINGISTKKYTDRDWDSYRNHTIGFVFQSYNLIPHQTVLGNVELALTISGVSKAERRRRAAAALEQVRMTLHAAGYYWKPRVHSLHDVEWKSFTPACGDRDIGHPVPRPNR